MKARHWVVFLLLGAIWSSSFCQATSETDPLATRNLTP
jgi:hypothetical protein